MRILHCADIHLDSKLTSNYTPEKARERRAELLESYQRMVAYGADHHVDCLLIAGDLFDTCRISAAARNTVLNSILNHPEIDFYYLRGNHDSDGFLEALDQLPENLKTFGEDWTFYDRGRVRIYGAEFNNGRAAFSYDALVPDRDKINIVMLHGQETPYTSDKTEAVNFNALKNKGIDYLALGHIHAHKEIAVDARCTACYPGCLEPRGFDETGKHGFVMLDIDEETGLIYRSFVPFSRREAGNIEVDVSDCLSSAEMADLACQVLDAEGVSDRNLVAVTLIGETDVEVEMDTEYLNAAFKDRFYLFRLYDKTRVRLDVERYRLDQSLKGEFVRTVLEDASLDEDSKALVIRYGFQALQGEVIG